jgi:Zn-dependent M28 family amino/carboxypeptidase
MHRLYLIVHLSLFVKICSAQSLSVDSVITPASLKELVQTLAADSFQGRRAGTKEAVKAAYFIADEFKKAGALPVAGNDGYFMAFYTRVGPITNVIAALPGHERAKELVIFSAHYDHIGAESNSAYDSDGKHADEIYNGANDNASGTSALIHLARYYAKQRNERTLIFIAFSGEEEGLLGSKKIALSFDPKRIAAMINMDMIGRPIAGDKKYPYITGDDQSNLRSILNKQLFKTAPQYGKAWFHEDRFTNDHLFARSDNYPFALRGIAAHTIMTSSPADMYYHSLHDEWDKLDYDFMAKVVKAIALACSGLTEGTDTAEKY